MTDAQQPCYLLELPPEIREEIYKYLWGIPLQFQEITVIETYYAKKIKRAGRTVRGSSAVLQTCKIIHHEAAPYFDHFERHRALYICVKDSGVPRPDTSCINEGDLSGGLNLDVEINIWDTGRETCYLLHGRVAALIKAINYGRGVKQLDILIFIREAEQYPGALCTAIETLSGSGAQISIKATTRSERILGLKNLEELARFVRG